jgi:hypothetical protein
LPAQAFAAGGVGEALEHGEAVGAEDGAAPRAARVLADLGVRGAVALVVGGAMAVVVRLAPGVRGAMAVVVRLARGMGPLRLGRLRPTVALRARFGLARAGDTGEGRAEETAQGATPGGGMAEGAGQPIKGMGIHTHASARVDADGD